jgi:hypothetical protein
MDIPEDREKWRMILTVVLLSVIILVSLAAIVTISYFWSRDRSELINPQYCPQIKGRYGLISAATSPVINAEIVVESLAEAESLCTLDSTCQGFAYIQGPRNGLTWFIDPNVVSPADRVNLYIKQDPLINVL